MRTLTQKAAMVFGVVFLLVGLLGAAAAGWHGNGGAP